MSWLVCWNENCQFCSNANQILEPLSQLFQMGFSINLQIIIALQYLLFTTKFKRSQWGNTSEFVFWVLVILVACILVALRHGCSPVSLQHIFRTPFLTTEGLFLFFFNTSENIRVTKASKILINFSFWLQHVIASKYLNEQLGVFLNMKQQNWS